MENKIRILIACEESQTVTKAFRKLGHEAFSCDIQECSGGKPEWHIQGDVNEQLYKGWDMMIAFPPCTHLAVSGARHFEAKRKDGRQQKAVEFFMQMINAPIDRIAVENPIGIMSSIYKKPTQIIQPFYFGDADRKTTCLWLKNLPLLEYALQDNLFMSKTSVKLELIETPMGDKLSKWHYDSYKLPNEEKSKMRSKTFPSVAKAMAEQWGSLSISSF